MMAVLTQAQLAAMGFAALGQNVQISDKASFYNCANISLGDHVRIDDFCVLSAGEGGIHIGRYVHIAVYCSIMGAGRITLSDYSGLSSRVSIYSSNDDYSGESMTNPTVPIALRNVRHAPVTLEKHVIVGSGSILLPGILLGEAAAIGALSLVNKNCEAFTVYAGTPARRIGLRERHLLELAAQLEP